MSAHFLHSTVEMDRSAILRRAAQPSHPAGAADHRPCRAPPWATKMHDHEFPTAEAVVAGLALGRRPVAADPGRQRRNEPRAPGRREVALVDNGLILLGREPA